MIKYLRNLFKEKKPVQLKDVNNIQFKDEIIPMNYPNVGSYKSGSLTTK